MKIKIAIPIVILLTSYLSILQAQPENDFCLDAIRINNVTKFCSRTSEFTNVNATYDSLAGDLPKPGCWTNEKNDVWFRFIAIATDVQITVNGNTLGRPQIALYTGNCSSASLLLCEDGTGNSSNTTLYRAGLTLGSTYWIRVNSYTNQNGTFQLCVNNYLPPRNQNGDCSTASVLCNKDPFHVLSVSGFGFIDDEADNTCLDLDNTDPTNNKSETNSTWFKWTAKTSGTLGFMITPEVINDDMDFAIYELATLDGCGSKRLLRCVATGCETGKPEPTCLRQGCLGPTGLRDNDNDFGENFNCDAGENGFAKSIDMVAGRSYALVVNNFSSAGNGFFLEFSGTAEFLGPTAKFSVNPPSGLKCTQPFTITDSSTFGAGSIVKYTWNFGEGAIPSEISNTKGPHNITYRSFGTKTIVLVVESDRGCTEVITQTINVEPCCEDLPTLKVEAAFMDLLCYGIADGMIQIGGRGGTPEYQYSLNDGIFKRQFKYINQGKGTYEAKIRDAKGCLDSVSFSIAEPPPIVVDAGPDQKSRLGYEARITGSYSPQVPLRSVRWIPPDGVVCDSCFSTDVIAPGTTEYKLVVTTVNGCVAVDSVLVEVSLDRALYVPNVFTPDKSGPNRLFKLYGNRAISSINSLKIYNRWGGLVYDGQNLNINDENAGWDGTYNGKPLPSGVYAYVAAVVFVDRVERIIKGDVTLLR